MKNHFTKIATVFILGLATACWAQDANELAKKLASKSETARLEAAKALAGLGAKAAPAAKALTHALKDSDAEVRAAAAVALGNIGSKDEAIVKGLISNITDKNPAVRRAIRQALVRIRAPRSLVIPLWVKTLESAPAEDAIAAVETLAEGGKAVVPALIEALDHENACYWAALAITDIGADAADAAMPLTKLFKHKDPECRMQAMMALAEIGKGAKSAVPGIVSALAKEDFKSVRYAGVYALGSIGAASDKASAAVAKGLESDDEFLKVVSAWASIELADGDKKTIQSSFKILTKGILSKDEAIRSIAAKGIAKTSAPNSITSPIVEEVIAKVDPAALSAAMDALAELGPVAVPRMVRGLDNDKLRGKALTVLQRIGADAKAAVPAVSKLLSSDDAEVVAEAQFTLGAIGPASKSAVDALIKSLQSDDDRVRYTACYALGKIGPDAKKAVKSLRASLKNAGDDQFQKMASVWALLRIRPKAKGIHKLAVPHLTKALSDEREHMRAEAAAALGDIGEAAMKALPKLKALLEDEHPGVKEAAQAAIKKLGG